MIHAATPFTHGASPKPEFRTGAARAWFAVIILCLAQIVSTIDRGMLALVIDPVRADLAISEVQIALLQGLAFSIFYVTMGLPLGAVADVVSRRLLLICGILLWSAATICGGLSADFGHMFASRLFIGVGEAVLGPCAVTMITDMFPPDRRGRPMSVYVFGTMIAYGLGSVVSGYILQAAPQGTFAWIPLVGTLAPWRIAFVLVGAFGFVIAALMLLMRDPPRLGGTGDARTRASLPASLAYFAGQRGIFAPLYAMVAFFGLGGSVATGWGAVLLTRAYGFDIGAAGKSLGTGQIIWAVIGAAVASVLIDRVARRSGVAGKIRFAAFMCLAAIPAALGGMVGNSIVAIALLSEITCASALFGTAMLSIISEATPTRMRGLSVALYAFVLTLIGFSCGPLLVAFLTEHVFHNPAAVGHSMAIVGTVSLVIGTGFGFLAAGRFHSSTANAAPLATPQ
ncbi:MFS transporter [Sphingobium sp. YR768]|uniref:MFS transporter n=1 Tax=Sphingobium sp. YR768 TaxID=1884365 RepID=UPI0008CCA121|nr:MFS transporter [Sphingobium sp. YR768]SER80117.1 Predicted arabinose efflux permease, MFS family [Sphingobium sp. YR768]